METFWTILILIVLVAVTAVPYWIRIKRHGRASERKFEKNKKAGLLQPVTLHPHIDLGKCIGCSSCVQVCPEDVLGMVGGKAAIISGMKCVGHALCEEVCPVGAIDLRFGTPGQGMEIPFYNDNYESNVTGLYIVGELGGVGLIRNAVNQARVAVEDIARKRKTPNGHEHDVIIVGAGPAGITAALAAKSKGMRYLVLEQDEVGGSLLHYPRKKLVLTSPVEIPLFGKLKISEITKEELLDLWHTIIDRTKLSISTQQKVAAVIKSSDGFHVETSRGAYSAPYVVMAIGRRGSPRKLGVPGEELPSVMYRLIEAEAYKRNHLLVVGGGDSAVEAACALAIQEGNAVTMSYRRGEFVRLKERNEQRIAELIKMKKVRVIFNSQVKEIHPAKVVVEQEQSSPLELENEYTFIFAGGELPGELLKKIGIKLRTDEINVPCA